MSDLIQPEIGEEFEISYRYKTQKFVSIVQKLRNCDHCDVPHEMGNGVSFGCLEVLCDSCDRKDGENVFFELIGAKVARTPTC